MSAARVPFLARSEDGILVQVAPCAAGGWMAALQDEDRAYRYFAAPAGPAGDEAARREAVAWVTSARAWRAH